MEDGSFVVSSYASFSWVGLRQSRLVIGQPKKTHLCRTGRVLGDDAFHRRLEKKLGRVPRRQKPGPKKAEGDNYVLCPKYPYFRTRTWPAMARMLKKVRPIVKDIQSKGMVTVPGRGYEREIARGGASGMFGFIGSWPGDTQTGSSPSPQEI